MRKPKVKKAPLEHIIDKLDDPSSFRYSGVEYDYDTYYSCRHGSDCCDNDYCRCGVIQNAHVTSVKMDEIFSTLTDGLDDSILLYCVDRILRASKVMEPDSWEVNTCRGYYGEEIDGVSLDSDVKKDVIETLSNLDNLSDIDKIKRVLEHEYGYILPRLQNLTQANIIEVALDSVKLFNDEYLRKVSKQSIDFYKDYTLPRGVCVKNGQFYSVIDGYHRMLSAQQNKKKTVSIIELK